MRIRPATRAHFGSYPLPPDVDAFGYEHAECLLAFVGGRQGLVPVLVHPDVGEHDARQLRGCKLLAHDGTLIVLARIKDVRALFARRNVVAAEHFERNARGVAPDWMMVVAVWPPRPDAPNGRLYPYPMGPVVWHAEGCA